MSTRKPTASIVDPGPGSGSGSAPLIKPDNNNGGEEGGEAAADHIDLGLTAPAAEVAATTEADDKTSKTDGAASPDPEAANDLEKPDQPAAVTTPKKTQSELPSSGTGTGPGSGLGSGPTFGTPKNIRLTRHSSPMLLMNTSPLSKSEGDAEAATATAACSDGEDLPCSSGPRKAISLPIIRGRKSIKELKEAKEMAAKLPEEQIHKEETKEATELMEGISPSSEPDVKDEVKDAKDTKDNVKVALIDLKPAEKENDKEKEKEKEKDRDKEKEKEKDKDKEENENDKEKEKDKNREEKEKNIEADVKEHIEKDKEKEATSKSISTPTATPTSGFVAAGSSSTCNRVTRKTHAQELALAISNSLNTTNNNTPNNTPSISNSNNNTPSTTRVTRNRRQSTSVNNTEQQQPQPQPQQQVRPRGRRKKATPAPPDAKEVLKRKRSDDDTESGLKLGKAEIKLDDEDEVGSLASSEGKATLNIKQEVPDAEEQPTSGATTTTTTTPLAATTAPAANRRGRGRPHGKGTPPAAIVVSTRATRHSKAGSPGVLTPATPTEPIPPKRRRVGSANRNLLISRANSNSATPAPDEDSKDSLASSTMDELLLLAATDIKQEKMIVDDEEPADQDQATTDPTAAAVSDVPEDSLVEASSSSNGGIEPLTVDTDIDMGKVVAPPAAGDDAPTADGDQDEVVVTSKSDTDMAADVLEADKAPSLSPEMISEGVSASSVKQFYKKPEFLANNLGIEKDPELGEIVQIASETDTDADAAPPQTELVVAEVTDKQSDTEQLQPDEEPEEQKEKETQLVAKEPTDAAEEMSSPAEFNGNVTEGQEPPRSKSKDDDYDEFEREIMEQLAMEGVLDASGNALSASSQPRSEKDAHADSKELPTLECDKLKSEEQELKEEQPEELLEEKKTAVDDDVVMADEAELLVSFKGEQPTLETADVEMHVLDKEENKENVSTTTMTTTLTADVATAATIASDTQESSPSKPEPKDQPEEEQKPPLITTEEEQVKLLDEVHLEKERLAKANRDKEVLLKHLGLLSQEAAEQLRQVHNRDASVRALYLQQHQTTTAGKRSGGKGAHVESSGTLKTVIKLNRGSNGGAAGGGSVSTGTVIQGGAGGVMSNSSMANATRKAGAVGGTSGASAAAAAAGGASVRRQSLKMTFHKGRARGHGAADRANDQHAHGEDSYYTIHENEDSSHSEGHGQGGQLGQGGGQAEHGFYQMQVKKDEKEKILIPEKASSFKFHPGRLCEDQCYYCSGTFGLYDTPCHVGQIKSVERQQKILANEEKLTVDNCLCDACFRHVDRRANAPSYKKRLSAPGHLETPGTGAPGNSVEKHFTTDTDGGESFTAVGGATATSTTTSAAGGGGGGATAVQRICVVKDCNDAGIHLLRRKCIRKTVKKCMLRIELPAGGSNVWLCEPHYNTFRFSGCVLCKGRLVKNQMYHITSDTARLQKALVEMGISVQLGVGTAVCKLCRYFANLLMKPRDSTKAQKTAFVNNYCTRLMKVHNQVDDVATNEADANELDELPEDQRGGEATTVATDDGIDMTRTAGTVETGTDLPMSMDYDGPTDSNSSGSSATPIGGQMSKLQAILQQNLAENTNSSTASVSATVGKAAGSSDISDVLRGNPNISMRELFHGEEELGVQFKVPFGCSSSQRTPEGWTRVQSFLQYDEPTRRLWEELQKPYGNQSSFIRHLILLEKYYRNGDLVLAPHASPNATHYTQTSRQRLNSFDHGHCGGLHTNSNSGRNTPAQIQTSSNTNSCSIVSGVLANALTTSQGMEQATSGAIPLVELNDDDEEDDDGGGGGGSGIDDEHVPAAAAAAAVQSGDDKEKSDSGFMTPLDVSVDKLTKQLSSNAVTIIARPKDATSSKQSLATVAACGGGAAAVAEQSTEDVMPMDAPSLVACNSSNSSSSSSSSLNSRSILKSNLLSMSVEILPVSNQQQQQQQQQQHQQQSSNKSGSASAMSASSAEKQKAVEKLPLTLYPLQKQQQKTTMSTTTIKQKQPAAPLSGTFIIKQQQPSSVTHPQLQSSSKANICNVAQLLSSPPELISLQRRRTAGATNVNASASVSGGATTTSSSVNLNAASGISAASVPALAGRRLQVPRAAGAGASGTPNVIILPDTLTAQERLESKSWKPTLIPLKENHKMPAKPPTLFQTADGRRLPAQVQVQSSGRPYLISIIDYNRMCILRREKLLRDQMLKANAAKSKTAQAQAQAQAEGQSSSQQQQQQQQQSQSSFGMSLSNLTKVQQTARQQLQQLQQQQQHSHTQQNKSLAQQQLPSLLPGGGAGGGGGGSGLRLTRIAPKIMPQLSSNIQSGSGSGSSAPGVSAAQTNPNFHSLVNALNPCTAGTSAASFGSTSTNSAVNSLSNISLDNNGSWLWKNFPDANQYLLNGNGNNATVSVASKLPQLTAKPTATVTSGNSASGSGGSGSGGGGGVITYTLKQQQFQMEQQKLIDKLLQSNIPKIPKSLTVIPQHLSGGSGSKAVPTSASGEKRLKTDAGKAIGSETGTATATGKGLRIGTTTEKRRTGGGNGNGTGRD